MDLMRILADGHAALDAAKTASEKEKVGTLRAGSAGAVVGDKVYGECHRKALARHLGVDGERDLPTKLMFAAGETNEDSWMKVLAAGYAGGIIKRESEIPVTFEVDGVKVTGRPDIVLCDASGTPEFGIELKGIFSVNTARDVGLVGKPKIENLIQAAVYMRELNVPYALAYTSRCYWKLDFNDRRKFPEAKYGTVRHFYKVFYMRWQGEVLEYRAEDQNDWTATPVTKQSLTDYYKLIVEMKATKQLGPRPATTDFEGGEAKWGGPCTYCDFKKSCDQHETDYDQWLTSIGGTP